MHEQTWKLQALLSIYILGCEVNMKGVDNAEKSSAEKVEICLCSHHRRKLSPMEIHSHFIHLMLPCLSFST